MLKLSNDIIKLLLLHCNENQIETLRKSCSTICSIINKNNLILAKYILTNKYKCIIYKYKHYYSILKNKNTCYTIPANSKNLIHFIKIFNK